MRCCSNSYNTNKAQDQQYLGQSYHLSMSSRIWFAHACPCVFMMYLPTQETRWSLKVPLISWWSKSGAINWWISARGKSFVNDYASDASQSDRIDEPTKCQWLHTTRSPTRPYSSHIMPSSNSLMSASVCSHECRPPATVRSLAVQLHNQSDLQ